MVTLRVDGLDKVLASISKLPDTTQRIGRKAIKESLLLIEDFSFKNHKYTARTGAADRAYKTTVSSSGLSGTIELDGTISNAPYIFALHEGSKEREIKPRNKKALYWVSGGQEFFSNKPIKRKATKPDRFLFQAATRKFYEVTQIMNKAVAKIIKEAGF